MSFQISDRLRGLPVFLEPRQRAISSQVHALLNQVMSQHATAETDEALVRARDASLVPQGRGGQLDVRA